MNSTYYFHRYLFIFTIVSASLNTWYFLCRLRRQKLARYMQLDHLRKLNIRSLALWCFFAFGIVTALSSLFVAIPKYSHGYFLNLFSQRITPAPTLFYSHGNYVLSHVGSSLAIVAAGLKSFFLFAVAVLFLPQAVLFLRDRSKVCDVLPFRTYRMLLYYAMVRLVVAPALLVALQSDKASDYDYGLLVNSIVCCTECIILGICLKGVAARLGEMVPGDAAPPPSGPAAGRAAGAATQAPHYSDRILLDNGTDDGAAALYGYLSANARYLAASVLLEGFLNAVLTLLLCFMENKDALPLARDLVTSGAVVAGALTCFFAGIHLVPLGRLGLVLERGDNVRLTNIESLFWKPSLFLMDREWRARIREERARRLAGLERHLPASRAVPSSSARRATGQQ